VVLAVKELDVAARKSTTSLWIASASDLDTQRRLTCAQYKSDHDPVWSVAIVFK
jgi:hypothetical protein